MKHPFWIVGHRGSPTEEVENTLPSFARALELEGANALELDISFTRDHQPVVWHDWDPDSYKARARQLGLEPYVRYRPFAPTGPYRKRVSQLSLAELTEHYGYADKRRQGQRTEVPIPTLGSFFEWASKQPTLGLVFFNLKVPEREVGLIPPLLRCIDSLVARFRPRFEIALETAGPRVLRTLTGLRTSYRCAIDVEPSPGIVVDFAAHSAVRAAIRGHVSYAMVQRPRMSTFFPFLVHQRIVERDIRDRRLHNSKRTRVPLEGIFSFTINEPGEMRWLIERGVDGIQSDRPALLRQTVHELQTSLAWPLRRDVPNSAT